MAPFITIYLSLVLLLGRSRLISCDADVITKFFAGYDRAVRPDFVDEGQATTILADLYVESFENIEEANMKWKDSRLAGKLNRTLTIKGADIRNIWVPDPYCYNARESNMMMPDSEMHSSVSIKPNGEIFYRKGVTLLTSCLMNLRSFPHDSQECYLKFGSYSYTTEDIVFKWNATDVSVGKDKMAQFEYKGATLSSYEDVFTTGNFSIITVTFSFQRRIGYYLIQVYVPDMLVVALSWIVFWMDNDDMGNRMALGITTILTIMFLLGSLNGTLPKVSYPKALDWYLLMSFAFVFLSLVECMIVFCLNLSAAGDIKKIKCKVNQIPISKKISQSLKSVIGTNKGEKCPKTNGHVVTKKSFQDDDLEMVEQASKANKSVVDDAAIKEFIGMSKKEMAAEYTDKASRVLFPLLFVVFNVVYWVYFTVAG